MTLHNSLTAALIGIGLGAIPVAAGAQASALVETPGTALYLNGGIGTEEADAIRSKARDFPLRVVFADGPRNDFTAAIPVVITDARGNRVLEMADAGPLLYVMLPEGRYTVIAQSDGIVKSQQVTLSRGQGRDVVFHWNTQTVSGM